MKKYSFGYPYKAFWRIPINLLRVDYDEKNVEKAAKELRELTGKEYHPMDDDYLLFVDIQVMMPISLTEAQIDIDG